MNRGELKQTPLFEKVDFVRQLAEQVLQIRNNDWYICKALTRLTHFKGSYVRKYGSRHLTTDELLFAEALQKNGISPASAYRWFLVSRAPSEVKEAVKAGKMTQNEALNRTVREKEIPGKELATEILMDIRRIMEDL